MGNGFQFIDIILFAMIAAFLIFRLRNVLGKRDGHEGGHHDHLGQRNGDSKNPANEDDDNVVQLNGHERDEASWADEDDETGSEDQQQPVVEADPIADGIAKIRKLDPSFDGEGFVNGARSAFEMILSAYAAGDTTTLKNLLSADVYGNFSQAIREREQVGEVLEDTLVDIMGADIVEAYTEGRQALVTIKFRSEQVNVTRDESGDVVDGNPSAIISVTDFWTFARDTRSRDPNWSLVATSSLD